MQPDQEIPVLLVSEHSLIREGLKSFFEQSRYRVRDEVSTIAKAIDLASDDIELVFLATSLDNDLLTPLRLLRASYPHSRIVLYAHGVHVPAATLMDVFGTSLDGCLLSNSSLEVLRQSLELIMMGGNIFPFTLLLAAFPPNGDVGEAAQSPVPVLFSDREQQVLRCLRDGQSNKFIARELAVSEATVKLHIKKLLGKIGCKNRTQAAIWMTKYEMPGKESAAQIAIPGSTV